jgi:signal transduction histidine kinase
MTTTTETTKKTATAETTTATTTSRAAARRDKPKVAWSSSLGSKVERLRWVPASLRSRILAWFIGVLALTTVSLVVVTYEVLLIRLDQRIDSELNQEAAELRRLATGIDPDTGRPFASVRRVFDVYLQRNVPSRNEVLITLLAGEPYLYSPADVPYRLDQNPEYVARWANPYLDESERGGLSTPAGRVEYLAVPVMPPAAADGPGGVFVTAVFRDRAKDEADSAVLAAGGIGIAVLLLGSLLAWRLADRVVRPVTALTQTARSISETDLSGRIPVQRRDEVAQLASTFNEMLDRLERAFDAQRRFTDDASHELKTPLTIVRGHLELLEDDPEERRETLALVTDELDRMARIVEDLLLLARREEPNFLDLSTVDVGTLTDTIMANVRALAQRDWVVDVRGQGVIVADRQRLTQAVMQLAENAARYSPPREPIAVGSIVSGGEARFWIRDNGPGIPKHEQEAIFQRFRRGAGPSRTEGAGLGLAIVKAIAEAHRGRVELESAQGRGATFSIVVPVDQPNPEPVR